MRAVTTRAGPAARRTQSWSRCAAPRPALATRKGWSIGTGRGRGLRSPRKWGGGWAFGEGGGRRLKAARLGSKGWHGMRDGTKVLGQGARRACHLYTLQRFACEGAVGQMTSVWLGPVVRHHGMHPPCFLDLNPMPKRGVETHACAHRAAPRRAQHPDTHKTPRPPSCRDPRFKDQGPDPRLDPMPRSSAP